MGLFPHPVGSVVALAYKGFAYSHCRESVYVVFHLSDNPVSLRDARKFYKPCFLLQVYPFPKTFCFTMVLDWI